MQEEKHKGHLAFIFHLAIDGTGRDRLRTVAAKATSALLRNGDSNPLASGAPLAQAFPSSAHHYPFRVERPVARADAPHHPHETTPCRAADAHPSVPSHRRSADYGGAESQLFSFPEGFPTKSSHVLLIEAGILAGNTIERVIESSRGRIRGQ
ncbi:hypothetical protein Csal_2519 [Chromohalobacter israelensis DSM 3043]|uniref:Uncharacterized protein n=1 Tax=Chromohalobacter israelensis (strain ATCC BAA-138 / DSM 3043 / CIP 106854 / NCIMB 13768 / 1H11) TaxID=290398 RepID=Q1QUJ2_CHRI1|nr:hypothetical protein Csal_2519 [Chromohalobacter salexigens DSM 3043]